MTNDNCLEGISCPKCGNEDRLFIVATILADVTDDGADIAKHSCVEWDRFSHAQCPDCGETGQVSHFHTEE
jgi:predicted nucleic-acid-binding Zn-ribbon protein